MDIFYTTCFETFSLAVYRDIITGGSEETVFCGLPKVDFSGFVV
jgi:hypothetical protein